MKETISSLIAFYRSHRKTRTKSKAYPIVSYTLAFLLLAFCLLLNFPQMIYGYKLTHKNFTVYSRQLIDRNIYEILDRAESRLTGSMIYSSEVRPVIFISDSHVLYALFSFYVGRNSFGRTYGLLPGGNIFINQTNVATDSVFNGTMATNNRRSLSGVIAHETTHLFLKQKLGYVQNVLTPPWKVEGYCDYVADESTLSDEMGVQKWKENQSDEPALRYFKYRMIVKHLLDEKKIGVAHLFSRDFDLKQLEVEVARNL